MEPGTLLKIWLPGRYAFAEVVDDATAEIEGARERPDRKYVYARWFNETRNISPIPISMTERATPLEVLGLL